MPAPFRTRDGTALFHRDWSPQGSPQGASGPPVVFAASWSLPSDSWCYQMLALAEAGFRCVAYDRRGHGRSDDPGRGYDFDTLAAADFRAEARAIGVPVLLLHGERDITSPLDLTARPTAALLPDARLEIYEDAPHGLFLTHQARLNADLIAFARG